MGNWKHRFSRLWTQQKIIFVLLFIVACGIYWVTGENHPTSYDYYVRLADAFIHGRLFLVEQPFWLNELIPFNGVFYVVYPPLPAVLLVPFVVVFGVSLNQTLVSVVVSGLCVVLAYVVAQDEEKGIEIHRIPVPKPPPRKPL